MTPEEMIAELTAEAKKADDAAHLASSAFVYGVWDQYWAAKQKQVLKQIEAMNEPETDSSGGSG